MREKGRTLTPIPVISLFIDKAGVGAEQSKLQEDIARPDSVDLSFPRNSVCFSIVDFCLVITYLRENVRLKLSR